MQFRRLSWLAALLALALAGLGYRLVDLQVFRHAALAQQAEDNTHHEMLLEPRRGDIFDARGNLLATSVLVKTVWADPSLVGSRAGEVARALSPLLQIRESELCQKLLPKIHQNELGKTVTNRYVILNPKCRGDVGEDPGDDGGTFVRDRRDQVAEGRAGGLS